MTISAYFNKLMESISLNNQQLKAIDHNRNIVLNAGAGTGKTHVLVERIVYLLEFIESLELKQIVAITFTVKASSELQDRLKNAFIKKIYESNDPRLQQKFQRGLEQLSQANITTIHGFLNRCLRTYSVEANLDSQYRIINDYERIEIKENAIIQALKTHLMKNSAITHLYRIYGRYDFFRLMSDLLENPQLLERTGFQSNNDLSQYWLEQQQKYKLDLLETIRTDKQFKYVLESVSKLRISGNPNKESTDFKQALQQVYLNLSDLNALKDLKLAFINLDGTIKKALLKRVDSNHHYTLEQFAGLILFYTGQILPDFNYRDDDYFKLYPDLVAFAKEVVSLQYAIKKDANVIDFNDLEIQSKRLFDTSHFAKSELRNMYRFFLIDEFQDTNLFQWQLLEQLIVNERNQIHPQKTFIVGDPKQSIYGFRNADVRVFNRVSNELIETNRRNNSLTKSFTFSKDMNSTMVEKEGLIVLNENYRSDKNIVHLVNNLFEQIFNSKNEYDVKSQSLVKANPKPDLDYENELILAVSKESDLEYETICQRIIQSCKSDFAYKDICVLVRNRVNSELLESTLKKYRIPYQSFLNQNFFNRQEIYDAYSLIRFVNYPDDNIALTSVLKSPFFKMTDSEIYQLKIDDMKSSLINRLIKKKHPAIERLDRIRNLAARMPVYDWLNYCFYQLDYFETNQFLRHQHESNINKLIDMIQNRVSRSPDDLFTVETFIKKQIDISFEESEAEIIINQNDNKVRLMTIHNSKGLEFPLVIICDMNKNNSRSGDTLYVNFDFGFYLNCSLNNDDKNEKGFCESFFRIKKLQRELAEEKRILYVAMTRAQRKIILSGTVTENNTDKIRTNSFLDLIRLSTKQNFLKTGQIKYADSLLKVSLIEESEERFEQAQFQNLKVESRKEKFDPNLLPISYENYFSVTKLETFKSPDDYKKKYMIGWFDEDPLFQFNNDMKTNTNDVGGSVYGSILHGLFELSGTIEITEDSCTAFLHKFAIPVDQFTELTNQLLSDYSIYTTSEKTGFIRNAPIVLREQRFTVKINDDFFEGILDLLIYDGSNWIIVDYKSNRIEQAEIEAKSLTYHFQMKSYAFLLWKRYPNQTKYSVHLYYPRIDGLYTMEFAANELVEFESEIRHQITKIKHFEHSLLINS